ncbi:hypothetical protein ACFWDI_16175 [Streptomyces sp. NPDC060064]|uniref:hypothetical protein n=1 Tax=Streptomyces sp. NPDC060064 TaxID=3347049 RepID=UPI0036C15A4F
MTKEAREALVLEHRESENRHEVGDTPRAFGHPRYAILATGQVFDGHNGELYGFPPAGRALR